MLVCEVLKWVNMTKNDTAQLSVHHNLLNDHHAVLQESEDAALRLFVHCLSETDPSMFLCSV